MKRLAPLAALLTLLLALTACGAASPPKEEAAHESETATLEELCGALDVSRPDLEERLAAYQPLLVDAVPLTLEEIFIYELGGADYAVHDIVL